MANEITTNVDFNIIPMDEKQLAVMAEELDGLGQIPFDVIKIPSGGGLVFEVPGDDPENPDTEKVIRGIIVHHHAVNAWWKEAYTGGNAAPDCASLDGKLGVDMVTGETKRCDTCPFNQFGSADNGNGKACKNGHRIYILREGEMLPLMISLPPTSLKALKDYLAKRLIMKGIRPVDVITEISLAKEKNADGISYSKCVFKKAGELSPEQKALSYAASDFVKRIVSNADTQTAFSSDDSGFSDVPEGEAGEF